MIIRKINWYKLEYQMRSLNHCKHVIKVIKKWDNFENILYICAALISITISILNSL